MRTANPKILHYTDLVVRIVTISSLLPLAFGVLFLAIMSTDSPASGTRPAFFILGLGAIAIFVLLLSSVFPDRVAAKISQKSFARWLIRLPSYIYAPAAVFILLAVFWQVIH